MMFSYWKDLVLDPFLGSGTTMLAAIHARRHCVGYEIYEKYHDIIIDRARLNQMRLSQFMGDKNG